jgi:hypothetical protein
MAVTAANLNHLETTKSSLAQPIAAAEAATGVTVAWVTDYDPILGGEKVVGATLVPNDGDLLATSSIELTIVGDDGVELGTISSHDGGRSWSTLAVPVAASDSLAASVVIDDRETVAAISGR